MPKVSFKATAKVNLTLDVLGRDPSGYHRIQTIYHEVPELYDELSFEFLDEPVIDITTDHPTLACDETNTVYRAASLFQKKYAPSKGIRIHFSKKIPLASGLGGGSSDAATTLKALNEGWGLGLSLTQLLTHAAEIGMDVPFFILGGCALGMHYGEHLMPLPTLQTVPGYEKARIEVNTEGPSVITAEAYKNLDLRRCGKRSRDTALLVKILKGANDDGIEPLLHNDFEKGKKSAWHLSGSGNSRFKISAFPPTPAST